MKRRTIDGVNRRVKGKEKKGKEKKGKGMRVRDRNQNTYNIIESKKELNI